MAVHPRKLLIEKEHILESGFPRFCVEKCSPDMRTSDPLCPDCKKCPYSPCNAPDSESDPGLTTPPPSTVLQNPSHHHKLSIYLTAAIVILGTAFFFFICYTVYRFYSYWSASRRRRSGRRETYGDDGPVEFLDEDHGPVVDHPIWYIRTVGLDPSVIGAITIVRYKTGEGLIDGTDCSVCLSEFQDGETLRLLPKCSHAFHIPCIDTWLRSHTNCPMCRARIVVDHTAPIPPPSVQTEETLIAVSDSEGDVRREANNETSGGESMAETGVKINQVSELDDAGVQPVRRSVSMDSLSASMISSAIANAYQARPDGNSEKQMVGKKERSGMLNHSLLRLIGSPSIERSVQTAGPSASTSAVRRTLSCSAKVFLSRHGSRSHNAGVPQ